MGRICYWKVRTRTTFVHTHLFGHPEYTESIELHKLSFVLLASNFRFPPKYYFQHIANLPQFLITLICSKVRNVRSKIKLDSPLLIQDMEKHNKFTKS